MSVSPGKVAALFEEVLRLEPGSRAAFIAETCRGDLALRERLEELLRADSDADAGGFMPEVPNDAESLEVRPVERPGDRIGRYRLLERIGEGGMGVVYMAEQEAPVRRHVAVKIIKLGMDTRRVVARFEAERQALAMMDHPNITRVLDAGATETGRPYFVMELVKGVAITTYCDTYQLDTAARLKLLVQVCHAIQHAHQKGVIHRDIKPSNVIVTLHDGQPVPKVIDFGVAKAINQRLTEKTLFTHGATVVGTPAYMSPEQARLNGLDIDTRTDIYALGVLLYELLTGAPPFPADTLLSKGLVEMQRLIAEVEAKRPSTCLSVMPEVERISVARNRGLDASSLARLLRGDLDWIVMKCLEKDRDRRYETAESLALDLQRHLGNEPVTARPPSTIYRLQKLARRNRAAFAASLAILTMLILATAVSTWQAVVATRARRIADEARTIATREQSLAGLERDRARGERDRAEKAKQVAEANAYAGAMLRIQSDWAAGRLGHLRQILRETGDYPLKGFEWYYWQRICRLELRTLEQQPTPVQILALSPDGRHLAIAGEVQTVQVRPVEGYRSNVVLAGHEGPIESVTFSPRGDRIITGGRDSTVRIWDAQDGNELRRFRGRVGVFAPDGRRALIGDIDGRILSRSIDQDDEALVLGEHDGLVKTVAFSPNGRRALSAGIDGTVRVWDATRASEARVLQGHSKEVMSAVFSPDGARIVSGSRDGTVRLWDVDRGAALHTLSQHGDEVLAVAFSPDGRRVASASADDTAIVWDAAAGTAMLTCRGHLDSVTSVAFSPDGRELITGSLDRAVKIWDSSKVPWPQVRTSPSDILNSIEFSPDGSRMVSAGMDGTLRVWDRATARDILILQGHRSHVTAAKFSPNGRWLFSGGHDCTLRRWNASTGVEEKSWADEFTTIFWIDVSSDGSRIVTGSGDGAIRVHDGSTLELLRRWEAHVGTVCSVEVSPDDKRAASGGDDGKVRVWDLETGRELYSTRGHRGTVYAVAFSPDGSTLATASADRSIRLWDTTTGDERRVLLGHAHNVWHVLFSPDGQRLASAGHDHTTRLWDVSTGHELLSLRSDLAIVMGIAFSPDGRCLARADHRGDVTFWELPPAEIAARWIHEEKEAQNQAAAEDRTANSPPLDSNSASTAGLISSWLILAPIEVPNAWEHRNLVRLPQIPDEANLRPREGDTVAHSAGTLTWKPSEFRDGAVDFQRYLGTYHSYSAGYAACYLRSDRARRGLRLRVGCDDLARIYLNGRLIYEWSVPRNYIRDDDAVVDVTLDAGVNTLIFKCINTTGPWKGSVRLLDENRQPPRGVEITLDPDSPVERQQGERN